MLQEIRNNIEQYYLHCIRMTRTRITLLVVLQSFQNIITKEDGLGEEYSKTLEQEWSEMGMTRERESEL